jgi:hypothetical protein
MKPLLGEIFTNHDAVMLNDATLNTIDVLSRETIPSTLDYIALIALILVVTIPLILRKM